MSSVARQRGTSPTKENFSISAILGFLQTKCEFFVANNEVDSGLKWISSHICAFHLLFPCFGKPKSLHVGP